MGVFQVGPLFSPQHCHPFFTDGTLRQSAGNLLGHTQTHTHTCRVGT